MLNVNQVPLDLGFYLAGFADGEGSFNVSFRPRKDYGGIPWKVSLCFNVSQKDSAVLFIFKKTLECGTMRQRKDGIWYYEVNNLREIQENVIPFFTKFGFLSSKKKRDFLKFQNLSKLFEEGRHRTEEGIVEILSIRRDMNDDGKRKFQDQEIMENLRILRDHTPNSKSLEMI